MAIPAHHIHYIFNTLVWRFRVIICLDHACSFRGSGSSYILNNPFHVAILVHHTSSKGPLIWRFRFIIYLKHTPSFGDAGSSYILNTPPNLAIPVHHMSQNPHVAIPTNHISYTRPLMWRCRFIIYLKHAPPPPPWQHDPLFANMSLQHAP